MFRRELPSDTTGTLDELMPMNTVIQLDAKKFVQLVATSLRDAPKPKHYHARWTQGGERFTQCLVALGDNAHQNTQLATTSQHPLIRAAFGRNDRLRALKPEILWSLARRDPNPLVREAALSNLENRSMRLTNLAQIPDAVANLGIGYLTLLQQLHNVSCAYLAVVAQANELEFVLPVRQTPNSYEIVDTVQERLNQMRAHGAQLLDAIEQLLPKFQNVLFMMNQVEYSTKIHDHLERFNKSGIDAMLAQLPGILIDAGVEIDRLYSEIDVQLSIFTHTDGLSLRATDAIDKLLEQGKNGVGGNG